MRQLIFVGLALVSLPVANAYAEPQLELSISASHRLDNLNWNIAGNTVNVLSELTWKNLAISQLQVAGIFNLNEDWQLRGKLAYGVINSGTNQDSDFHGNNRSQEFSRTNNKAGGNVRDADIGFGKSLQLFDQTGDTFIYFTPLAGLSLHQQNLTMTEGVQTIPASGPFPGLASSYDTQWLGTWIGANTLIDMGRKLSLIANAEYHWADYTAKANWNMRSDFAHPVSFRHTAKGQGIVLSAGAAYPFHHDWKINFTMDYQKWNTDPGYDWSYLADGTMGYTRLNAVNWNSTSYNLGISHQF